MEPSVQDLKQTYQRYDDEKLMRIATQDADGLRPEAVLALQEVIKERGLSEDIIKGLEVQRQEIDEEALLGYVNMLRELPCPICGATGPKLNGTIAGTVVSFIIMTNYEKRLKIACPTCLDKANNAAIAKSSALGWWGFPWGIIRTIQSLTLNNRMKSQNHIDGPNETLVAFTMANIGKIEAHRNNKARLFELVKDID